MAKGELEHLQDFLLDIDCLTPLNKWYDSVNFFEISGMVNKEVKHSRVLSWILDSNATHGFGDAVIRRFLQKVIKINDIDSIDIVDVSLFDYGSFVVKNEWNNIDVLLVSDKEQTVIVIENKVYANERTDGDDGGQLNKYRQIINQHYSTYKKLLIFLTREGELPSDTDNWAIADYSMATDTINDVLDTIDIQSETKTILKHYISMVRRHLIMDEKLQEKCKQIYMKHRIALDLIYENKPDLLTDIFDYVKAYITENAEKYSIIIEEGGGAKNIRFLTKNIIRIIPKTLEMDYGWKNGYRFMYEIKSYLGDVHGAGFIAKPDDELCNKLFDFAKNNPNKSGTPKKITKPRPFESVYAKGGIFLTKNEAKEWANAEEVIQKKLENKLRTFLESLSIYEAEIEKYLSDNIDEKTNVKETI